MFKITTKDADGGMRSRVKIRCRSKGQLLNEAAGVIASICVSINKAEPDVTPESLMRLAMKQIDESAVTKVK